MVKILGVLSAFIAILGLMVVMPFVMGFILMLLWNAILPDLFSLPQISYLQSVGLYFISGILIKGDFSSLFSSITGIRLRGIARSVGKQADNDPD